MDDVGRLRERADDLDAIARTLDDQAAQLHAALDVDWVSSSADRWRAETAATVRALGEEAAQLRQASRHLRRHADEVAAAQASAQRAFAWFQQRVEGASTTIARGAEVVGRTAYDAAVALVDAARHAPSPTSPDWRWWHG